MVLDRGLIPKRVIPFLHIQAEADKHVQSCQCCHSPDDVRYLTFDQKPVWPRFDLTPMWFSNAEDNIEPWYFNVEARCSWLQSDMYSLITEVASWKNGGGPMGLWENHVGEHLAQGLWLYGLGPGPVKENRTRVVRHVKAMRASKGHACKKKLLP